MEINKGDIFFAPVYDENGNKRDIDHPQVVIQETVINQSRIDTVVACGLSTNMKRAYIQGNILLDLNEGNLPKRSIIIVSQISVVKKSDIKEYIGSLSDNRVQQIFAGMNLIQNV
ncbi:MAG: type II toxin-antitoxin system PemK/MazF family toxin [Spirochaetaceae bacterium]